VRFVTAVLVVGLVGVGLSRRDTDVDTTPILKASWHRDLDLATVPVTKRTITVLYMPSKPTTLSEEPVVRNTGVSSRQRETSAQR
jgi:hypothetical protein